MIAPGPADRRTVAEAPGFGYDGPGARTLGRRKETRPTMTLGMTLETFTRLHVVISLIGIASGLMAVFGMMFGVRRDGWTTLFLWTTVLTSVTGFGFPVEHLLPSHKVGIISRIVARTRARARMSSAGSPSSTTTSAANPGASRPVRAAPPKRAAGAVVSAARICAYDRPACCMYTYSSVGSYSFM